MFDINNWDAVINFAIIEASNFKKPKNFCGGRFQTNHENIFIHVNSKGQLAKIEINKKGGSKFFLSPY